MSRCFPFPPPGYEKKIRIEEADSLIKEKQKDEKKHKKEKKDREKKEGKDKRVKETSKDKHKEWKEKKEKHRDKKDKNRDKEKSSRSSEDKKSASVLSNTGDREKLVTSTSQNNGNGESKFIQDLARRIRNNEEATESQSRRKTDFPGEVTENNISCSVPHTKDEKRTNSHRNFTTAKRSETAVLPVSSSMDQKRAEVMVKPVAKKDQNKKKELQEQNHCRESVRKSDKPLDNEWIQKNEPKNITDRSSKEKKEVINKTVQEKPKFLEGGPRLEERGHNSVGTRDFGVQDLSKAGVKNLTSEEILSKQKDLETNGFLYENGSRPNKIQKHVASPLLSMENGRKLGACQTSLKPVSELQGTMCNPELKEHRINGFIDPQEAKSLSSVKLKENGEASARKRPHPDLKYLDQILEVPKREELHEVEQEWLCGQSGVKLLKKQRTYSISSLDDETPQVWNQALRIESADILALPYSPAQLKWWKFWEVTGYKALDDSNHEIGEASKGWLESADIVALPYVIPF